jgi:negative regulator of sigma-B (phosphoserine phosphatase)
VKTAVHHISVPRDGEGVNGDRVVVTASEGSTMLGLIDALGHGAHAAHVADAAAKALESSDPARGVEAIVAHVHAALRGGRGACLLACVIGNGWIEGASVGNVELRARGVDVPFVQTPGVVGVRIPRLRVFRAPLRTPLRLVAYSDGISSRFQVADYADFSTELACRAIFDRGRRPHDDASVLVADFGA